MAQQAAVERADDPQAAMSTLMAAFVGDPIMRWLFERPAAYFEAFPRIASALIGPAFQHGGTWQTEHGAAVAIWMPPGVEADFGAIVAALEATAPAHKRDEMMQLGEQIGHAHPEEPHWYLTYLAVDPARQGAGLGAHLLQQTLRAVDETGMPAYLESPNGRNLSLYQRHGFELIGQTDTATAPPAYFMWRQGRR